MGRPLKGREHLQFRKLTEEIHGHRTRLKDTSIPEIFAWLTARRMIAEDCLKVIREAYSRTKTAKLKGMEHHLRRQVSCINELIYKLMDPISRPVWESATTETSSVLEIDINKPQPDFDALWEAQFKTPTDMELNNELSGK